MNKIVVAIVGRSASGKTTLCEYARGKGVHVVDSCTTRPMRHKDEQGHKFCTFKDYIEDVNNGAIIAETVFNDYHYWATSDQLKDGLNFYIVDIKGMEQLQACPQLKVVTVALNVPRETLVERLIDRDGHDGRAKHDDIAFQGVENIKFDIVFCNAHQTPLDKQLGIIKDYVNAKFGGNK